MSADRRIDGRQVRALVRAYIVMSFRAMPMRAGSGERKGGGSRALILMLGVYTLLGGAMSVTATLSKDVFDYSFTLHLMTLFVVGSAAMNEASEVLFNTSENEVLLHRPIHASTLVLAKAATIVCFTLLLAGAINLFPTFAMLAVEDARPWAPLAHIASVLMATLFAAATVVCGYGAVARLLGRERFQRVVTFAQIASTLFIVAGFQIMPRLLGQMQLGTLAHEPGWIWLAPPTWFAALDSVLGTGEAFGVLLWPAAFGLVLTLVLAWLGVLRLPTTSNSIASLQEEPRKAIEPEPVRKVRARGRSSGLLDLWMRDPVERASFRLAAAYILRERAIKVRLAAALAFYFVFPLITLVNPQKHSDFMPLMILWMTTLVPFTVLEALRVSSHPAAADVFAVTPIRDPSRIFHGVRKASILLVQLPLLVYVALIGVWSTRQNPELILLGVPALIAMPPISLLPGLIGDYLPLSLAQRTGQRTVQVLYMFLGMGLAGGLAALTFVAWKLGWIWPFLAGETLAMAGLHVALRAWLGRRARRREVAKWSSAASEAAQGA